MIDHLDNWDFPDKKLVPDGYDLTQVPQATDDNMLVLIEKINEIIDIVNSLNGAGPEE